MAFVRKPVELDYPAKLVTKPVLSGIVRRHGVDVNIRRASTTKGFGYVQCEITGEEEAVKAALQDLLEQGVEVKPIEKDVVE